MSSKMIQGPEVTRPSTTPPNSSVLDHALAAGNVSVNRSIGLRNEHGMWVSYNCLGLPDIVDYCDTSQDFRTYDVADWQPGFSFALIKGVQCSAVGLDEDDMKAEITRVFEETEGRALERALLDRRFQSQASTPDPHDAGWAAPVDVTPSTPVPLHVALALLEGYAAANYVGTPTIHMPRAAASLLNERIVYRDNLAYTRSGSRVAMGGGYDVALDSGQWTMYATGEVAFERQDVQVHQMMVTPGDGSSAGSDGNQLEDNTVIADALRLYRATVDCMVAEVTGTVWS